MNLRRSFDGVSIGSNDLTQLILGVDRTASCSLYYDERDRAVKKTIRTVIERAHALSITASRSADRRRRTIQTSPSALVE